MLETLSAGRVHTIEEDVVYCLPPKAVFVQASAVCEVSLVSTTGFTALASTTTGVQTAMPYIRCTTAAATISVKSV